MTTQRTVWKTPSAGAMSRLTLQEEALGPVDPKKIRVDVKGVGLNFADIFAIVGLYSATPDGPFIPGLEFAGVVDEVGGDVEGSDWKPGDRVMGVIRFGGYATSVEVKPLYLRPLPEGWNFAEGAGYLAQSLTAWYAVKSLGDIQPHHGVLIQSAAGGVGLQAMRICRKLGNYALGTVGRPEKIEFLKEQGFEEAIVRDAKRFVAQVREALGDRKLHLILETIGGHYQRDCYELLEPTGRLVVFGSAQYTPGKNRPNYLKALFQYLFRPKFDPLYMISDNKSVMGFNLIWLWEETEQLVPLLDGLDGLDLEPPVVGKEFPFDQAHQALEWLRSGKSVGKVVLVVD